MSSLEFLSLEGLRPYAAVREFQLELVEKRARGEIPDTVLFVEHEPVVTRGRGLQWVGEPRERSVPLGPLPPGVAFFEAERGGDLTYHGPGQLVVYPIVRLDGAGFGPSRDIAAYLRKLEGVLAEVLATYGVQAGTRQNATGVWVREASGASGAYHRKIASIGIAIRKWVAFHGIGLNAVNSLEPFQLISPCGFAPEVMTRLADYSPLGPDWRPELESRLRAGFLAQAPAETPAGGESGL
jgi:lipoate-protein ligase B